MARKKDILKFACLSIQIVGFILFGGVTSSAQTAAYLINGTNAAYTNLTVTATSSNQSAFWVYNGGSLTLINPTITTSGNTTNEDNSSFYGLNAAVTAATNSSVKIVGGSVYTSGSGANGVFAVGTSATVTLSNLTITCKGQGGHGVDATFGGSLIVSNCTASTAGNNGSVIATDRGGGTIYVYGGTYTAAGQDSAGVYSTGTIVVNNATVGSTGGEAVVVEGSNSALLTNCALSGVAGTRDRGVFVYQSTSGDSSGQDGVVDMVGGSYYWPSTSGPAFYISNTRAYIFVKNVTMTNKSGSLISATTNQWGTTGANGGTVYFIADSQTLTGGITCDSYSSNYITLQNGSSLTGGINPAFLLIDSNSSWSITSNSYLKALTNAGTISGSYNITNVGYVYLQGGSISAALVGTNGLLKYMTNTALLSGACTYGGATTVTNGELIIGSKFAGIGNFLVTNSATLGITNQFFGSAAVSNLTVATGSTLEFFNVSNLSAAPLVVSNIVLGGSAKIKLTGSNYLTAGATYPLVSNAGTFSGTFANFTLQLPTGFTGSLVSNAHVVSLILAPAAPTNVVATNGDSLVVLIWNSVSNATGYNVKRSLTSGGTFSTVGSVTTTNYTNSGLVNGTLYYYEIAATNAGGEGTVSSQASGRAVSTTSTNFTTSFSCSSGTLTFTWPTNHTGWRLQVQTNMSGIASNWVDVASSTSTNSVSVSISSTNGCVFYRMVYP